MRPRPELLGQQRGSFSRLGVCVSELSVQCPGGGSPPRLSLHCSSPVGTRNTRPPPAPACRAAWLSRVPWTAAAEPEAPDTCESFLPDDTGSGMQQRERKRAPARKKIERPTIDYNNKKRWRQWLEPGSGKRWWRQAVSPEGYRWLPGERAKLHNAFNRSKRASSFTSSLRGAWGGESGRSSPLRALLSFARAFWVSRTGALFVFKCSRCLGGSSVRWRS